MFRTAPLLTLSEACALRASMEREGKRLVFTNGCFDLLHGGHIRYLTEARALGDALLVGLNSDASVRQLKGSGRPVNQLQDRAGLLRMVQGVDGVISFDEPRATSLMRSLRPHLYAKGGDYSLESLDPDERAILESGGAEIRLLSKVEGLSTTALMPGGMAERLSDRVDARPATAPMPVCCPVIVGSASQIIDRYEAIILDQWGVIHDGNSLLQGVEPFLRGLREHNIPAIVATNSGRPATFNEARLKARFGIGREWYRLLVSSFDVLCDQLGTLARFPVLAIAAEGEEEFLQEAGIPLTSSVQEARSIAILSVPPDTSVEGFRIIADFAAEHGLPVICSGRDDLRVTPGTVAPGIGRLADFFAALGANVRNAGKPERPLYDRCLCALPDISPSRILAIGDQFSPDVQGANAAGIESALVLTGATSVVTLPMLRALAPLNCPKWIAGTLA